MVDEKVVALKDLPLLECDFDWNSASLQTKIKAYKPDYRCKDPWTWPRIDSMDHPGLRNDQRVLTLPSGVAHSESLVQGFTRRCHKVKVKQTGTGEKVEMYHELFNFPYAYGRCNSFNYDRLGTSCRARWIEKVTGKPPFKIKVIRLKVGMKEVKKEEVSSTEVFNEVLKMMNDVPPDNSTEPEALRKDLSGTKERPWINENGKERLTNELLAAGHGQADAGKRIRALESDHESFKKIADEYIAKYNSAYKDLQASHKQREEEEAEHEQEIEKSKKLSAKIKTLET